MERWYKGSNDGVILPSSIVSSTAWVRQTVSLLSLYSVRRTVKPYFHRRSWTPQWNQVKRCRRIFRAQDHSINRSSW